MAVTIAHEGSEGVGKSLITALAVDLLKNTTNFPIEALYEPGSTVAGNYLRGMLKIPEFSDMEPLTNLFIYTAARSETFSKVIEPFIRNNPNGILVADRCWWSTFVHQASDGVDEEYIRLTQKPFMGYPDKVVFIDAPVEESLLRIQLEKMSGRTADWRDDVKREVFEANRDRYHALVREFSDKTIVVDGFQNPWVTAYHVRQTALMEISKDERFRGQAVEALNSFTLKDLYGYADEMQRTERMDLNTINRRLQHLRAELNAPPAEILRERMYAEWRERGLMDNVFVVERER